MAWVDTPISKLPDNPSVDAVVLAFAKACFYECDPRQFLPQGKKVSRDRVTTACDTCGKEFTQSASNHHYNRRRRGGDFCSPGCAGVKQ